MSQPIFDRKKHRQEIESLKADNRQKDMNRRSSESRDESLLSIFAESRRRSTKSTFDARVRGEAKLA